MVNTTGGLVNSLLPNFCIIKLQLAACCALVKCNLLVTRVFMFMFDIYIFGLINVSILKRSQTDHIDSECHKLLQINVIF